MSAATQNRYGQRQESVLVPYTGSSGFHYYKDTLIIKDGTNSAAIFPLTFAGSSFGYFLGVASNEVNQAAGLGSSQEVLNLWKRGEFTFAANGSGASAHIGQIAYGLDDQTVGVSIAQPAIPVGEIVGIPTSTSYRVRIDNHINARGISRFQN